MTRICPGFEEWWLGLKSPKLVIFNFYVQTMSRIFLVDTTYICTYVLCKAAGN